MKQKTGIVIGLLLLLAGVLVIAYGYFTDYTPYVSYENGYTYIDYVAIFGYLFLFAGVLIVLFFIIRGKCALCGNSLGRNRTFCTICGDDFCSSRCKDDHEQQKHIES